MRPTPCPQAARAFSRTGPAGRRHVARRSGKAARLHAERRDDGRETHPRRVLASLGAAGSFLKTVGNHLSAVTAGMIDEYGMQSTTGTALRARRVEQDETG